MKDRSRKQIIIFFITSVKCELTDAPIASDLTGVSGDRWRRMPPGCSPSLLLVPDATCLLLVPDATLALSNE